MVRTVFKDTQDCVFCKIVDGSAPSFKIWESATHLAFLSIFPNTPGATVVIPKKHFESYVFNLSNEDLFQLMLASQVVAKLLDEKFADVGRTALVFEGFGVNHVHAKLFPMHGTAAFKEWQPVKSSVKKFFDVYEGYISSHDGERATDQELQDLAAFIRS